ncbi:MAG: deacylase [Candidatus Marinimicrobia bacterium]|nr:deacylase [Candidatus Neomarinimicrobiota bacterium]
MSVSFSSRIGAGFFLALIFAAAPVGAKDQSLVTLSAGLFDLVSHRTQEFEGRAEYRHGQGFFETVGAFRGFKPIIGIMGNSAGAVFGYAGLAAPIVIGAKRWEIVPSGGVGGYHEGDGIFLGGTFEFHVGLSASYALSENSRLGVALYHISNANTHRKNPGVNSILLQWSLAFD